MGLWEPQYINKFQLAAKNGTKKQIGCQSYEAL